MESKQEEPTLDGHSPEDAQPERKNAAENIPVHSPQRVRALSRLILHGRVAARRGSENALSLTTKSGTVLLPF